MSDLVFKAIIEIAEVISNPAKLKAAAQASAAAVALKAEELAQRDEYNLLLACTRAEAQELEAIKQSIDFQQKEMADRETVLAQIDKLNTLEKAAVDKQREELARQRAEFEESCALKSRELDIAGSALSVRERAVQESEQALTAREATIAAKEAELDKYRELLGGK